MNKNMSFANHSERIKLFVTSMYAYATRRQNQRASTAY